MARILLLNRGHNELLEVFRHNKVQLFSSENTVVEILSSTTWGLINGVNTPKEVVTSNIQKGLDALVDSFDKNNDVIWLHGSPRVNSFFVDHLFTTYGGFIPLFLEGSINGNPDIFLAAP